MTRQRLLIGIQDFETIRSENFYDVDKTPLIRQLVDDGRDGFLFRFKALLFQTGYLTITDEKQEGHRIVY